jgi:hypothetical protein
MKKLHISLLSMLALLTVATTSCDLEKYPYSDIEQSQAFKTIKDATTLRNGMYASLRGNLNGIYMFSTDVQADILNATLDYGNRNGAQHKWTSFLADDYTIRDTWYGYYNALININDFIEKAPSIPVTTDADKAAINQYLGDAHLLRAFYYHQLVQRFAKDYEPASAASDLGVPIVLKFDVTAKPARNTVAQVYDQIISDINAAKSLLANTVGTPMAIRLNKDCALALEARVKLCMHDWTGAKTAADALITAGTYPLESTAAGFKKMWVNDNNPEIMMQVFASQPSELGNANNIYLGYNAQTTKYTPDFVPQQWIIDLYDAADIRKGAYLEQKDLYIQGKEYPSVYLINKYPGNPALYEGVTNYQHKPILFRIAEMYLISAEAGAQVATTEGAALATLNTLRNKRGLSTLTNLTGTALMDAIKTERLREMLCEGTRIDDLKRWKMGFSRKSAQDEEFIITGSDYNQKTVPANDNKFVWGIPKNDISTNPNIKQNPGW